MLEDKKNSPKDKTPDNSTQQTPVVRPTRTSTKKKILTALKNKDALESSLYVDAHKLVNVYKELFKKKGHNIIENSKNLKKSRSKK